MNLELKSKGKNVYMSPRNRKQGNGNKEMADKETLMWEKADSAGGDLPYCSPHCYIH